MPIWHSDKLCKLTGTLDIGLIKDKAYLTSPHTGPRIEVPPLRKNLNDPNAQGSANPTLTSSSHVANKPPKSSRSTPPFQALVLLV